MPCLKLKKDFDILLYVQYYVDNRHMGHFVK